MPFGLGTNFDPNGEPREVAIPGIRPEFTTSVALADAATFNSGIVHIGQFQHLSVELESDRNCSIAGYWYSDSAGTTLVKTFTLSYVTGSGISFYGDSVFTPWLRIIITNNSGGAMTRLFHQVRLTDEHHLPTVLRANDTVPATALTSMNKSVMAGFNVGTGVITNVDVDTANAMKTYLSGALATSIDTKLTTLTTEVNDEALAGRTNETTEHTTTRATITTKSNEEQAKLDTIEASLTSMELDLEATTTAVGNVQTEINDEALAIRNNNTAEHTSTRTQIDLVRTEINDEALAGRTNETAEHTSTRTQINAVATAVTTEGNETQAKLDTIEASLTSMELDLEATTAQLVAVNAELDTQTTSLSTINTSVRAVETDVEANTTQLIAVNSALSTLNTSVLAVQTEVNDESSVTRATIESVGEELEAKSGVITNRRFNLDLAGRFRTSEKDTVFTHSPKSSKNHVQIEQLTGGGTSTLNFNETTVSLTNTTASGDKVTRQSHIYCPYLEGSPVLCKATAVFAASKTNVAQRVGMFDDLNGLFFEDDGTGMGVVRRTSTSGSVVNNRTAQASWNIDKLDGTGPSGLTVSAWNFLILFEIQYLWQGAIGAVWGIRKMTFSDGELWSQFIPVHYYSAFDNSLAVPFIGKPSLPVRYEIENTGVAASSTTFKQCCADIVAEGGHRLVGSDWDVDNFDAVRALSATAEVPVLAVRLADSFNGNPNRRMIKYLQANGHSSAIGCDFRIRVVHQPTSTTGGTWTDIDAGDSGIQYNTGITAINGGDAHQVDSFTVSSSGSGGASRGGTGSAQGRFEDSHSIVVQNIASNKSDLIVLYAKPHDTTATNIRVGMKLLEFE